MFMPPVSFIYVSISYIVFGILSHIAMCYYNSRVDDYREKIQYPLISSVVWPIVVSVMVVLYISFFFGNVSENLEGYFRRKKEQSSERKE